MLHREIVSWLCETDEARLAELWRAADRVRQQYVGGDVHLCGLVELSNYCVRLCGYCGLRAPNDGLTRYRMSEDEIMDCVEKAVSLGYGTVVLQSGEDPGIRAEWMAALVRRIKAETPLAVTLSLGERSDAELAAWRRAGADRYLLRFETSNRALYERIHPPKPDAPSGRDRMAILRTLKELGYEVGSGVMIGIPGQTYDDLARDIAWFAELELDVIRCGPYLMHPDTPLGSPDYQAVLPGEDQVPGNELTSHKVIALSRLVCPQANIHSTSDRATFHSKDGRELGLVRGANVITPNLTPPEYRALYQVYPNRACIQETADGCHRCVQGRIESIGRPAATGRGDSPG